MDDEKKSQKDSEEEEEEVDQDLITYIEKGNDKKEKK